MRPHPGEPRFEWRRLFAIAVFLLAACGGGTDGSGDDGSTAGGSGNASNGGSGGSNGGSGGNAGGGGTGASSGAGGGEGKPGVVIDGTCYPLCSEGTMGSASEPDWGFEDNKSCVVRGTQTSVAVGCTTGQPVPDPDATPVPGVVLDGTCYPLCAVATTGTADAADWNYENGRSCIVPGTRTAVAQHCTTGQPLPDPSELCGRPGVVTLDSGGTNERVCSALCTYRTDPATDPEGDDWDYEYSASCVIPTSPTSRNQTCATCAAVPGVLAKPGVVVVDGGGVAGCVPLCVVNTNPATDPEGDDWGYEDNSSCVIPGTAPALTNPACTTGSPLPEPQPRPGVEVSIDGTLGCVAKCTFYTSKTQDGANDDGRADDWAWEANAGCIIPGTVTASNTACTTLMPLPPPAPRPGIVVNSDPVMDSCKTSACVPLCRVAMAPSDPAFPDWSYEDNASCVLPNSTTARVIPKAVENHGYEVPPRRCTWGATKPNFLAPPALTASRTVQAHFQTSGRELRDPYGQPFLIRGVNNSHAWYDICGQYSAYEALDNIAARGANAVRVGWAFQSIDPGGPGAGDPQKAVIGTNAELLAEILYRIVELKMIPILAVNDTTGQTGSGEPMRMAQLLNSAAYKPVFEAYEPYLLIGIANELNIAAASFLSSYTQAVQYLRTNGFDHTLVVTGNDWGQGCDSILDNASQLSTADPRHNILYDIHIYNYLTYQGGHGGTAQIVQGCMDSAASAQIPFLVGEFGHTHGGTAVQWQTILTRANANAQGFTPWLWYGDTEYPALNMNTTWEGPLTSWGTNLGALAGTKASIFP